MQYDGGGPSKNMRLNDNDRNPGGVSFFFRIEVFRCSLYLSFTVQPTAEAKQLSSSLLTKTVSVFAERTSGYPSDVRAAIVQLWLSRILARCRDFDAVFAAKFVVRCVGKSDGKRCVVLAGCLSHGAGATKERILELLGGLSSRRGSSFDECELDMVALLTSAYLINSLGGDDELNKTISRQAVYVSYKIIYFLNLLFLEVP